MPNLSVSLSAEDLFFITQKKISPTKVFTAGVVVVKHTDVNQFVKWYKDKFTEQENLAKRIENYENQIKELSADKEKLTNDYNREYAKNTQLENKVKLLTEHVNILRDKAAGVVAKEQPEKPIARANNDQENRLRLSELERLTARIPDLETLNQNIDKNQLKKVARQLKKVIDDNPENRKMSYDDLAGIITSVMKTADKSEIQVFIHKLEDYNAIRPAGVGKFDILYKPNTTETF